MLIEIKNYNPSIASKSLVASFDVIFRDWGFIIRECKLFDNQGKKWFIMPNKAVKNGDGTWGKAVPYFEFLGKEMHFKMQELVLEEIQKSLGPSARFDQPPAQCEYYPSGAERGEYQQPELPLNTYKDEGIPF